MAERAPKELLTALRGLRRRYGRAIFDATVRGLSMGEIDIKPRKSGRPGIEEGLRIINAWGQVVAYMRVYSIDENEAAKRAAKITMLVQGDNGSRRATRTAGTILRDYKKAEKQRTKSHSYVITTDAVALMNQKMLARKLLKNPS